MIATTPAKIGRVMKKFTTAKNRMALVPSDGRKHGYEEDGRRRTAPFSKDRSNSL
jgi:hypothetical protein